MSDPLGNADKSTRLPTTGRPANLEGRPPVQGGPSPAASSLRNSLADTFDAHSKKEENDHSALRETEEELKEAKLAAEGAKIAEMKQEAAERFERKMSAASKALVMGIIAVIAAAMAVVASSFANHGGSGAGGVSDEIPSSYSDESTLGGARMAAATQPGGEAASSSSGNQEPGNAPSLPPSAGCEIKIVYPPAPSVIPEIGPIEIEWTHPAGAVAYDLKVGAVGGVRPPWLLSTPLTSKKIYMENFPDGGDYEMSVSARSAKGKVLCVASLTFTKPETELPTKTSKDTEGSGAPVPCNTKPCP